MIRKHVIFFVLLLLLIVPTIWAQRAIRPLETSIRQALVIGNSNYAHAGILRNPVNDAKAIGSTLQQLGFQVETLINASQPEMDQAIRKFGRQLQGNNGVGLFYYAGHGMQINGENYLLPVEINPSTEADVRYRGVPVGQLLGQMEAADNGMNIVILDACRTNPFARSFRSSRRGLAQMTAPAGTFISYATAPGKEADDGAGDNGLFTAKLLKHMKTPGLKLEEVFKLVRSDVQRESNDKQVPWDSSSVTGEFFFLEPKNKEEEILRKREEEIRRKEEEILRKREENTQKGTSSEDSVLIIPEETDEKDNSFQYQNLEPKNSLKSDSLKLKIMGGYASGGLSLEKDLSAYKEELDVPSLVLSGRYFISENIGLEFATAGGSVRGLKISDGSEGHNEKAEGTHNTTLLGVSYNWGGAENSILGNWWTVFAGLGAGSSTAKFNIENSEEELTVAFQGLALMLGFDYRTENNWLLGLSFYQVSGNPTGSRIQQLENNAGETTASTFLGVGMVGYQFN